tara:strand:+ start:381 stop:995 length:615 start_codon:yes stop_codon:yes gene_type:complete
MQSTTPTVFEEASLFDRPDESRFAGDSKLYVEFSRRPILQPGKSREEGRAIYQEVNYVRIYVPGDKGSVVERPVTEQDAYRFAERYAKWKAGQEEAVTGTPLSSLPTMSASKVEEYKYFKIVTVEQLAEANDNLGAKFMSFNQDKQRAAAFMLAAKEHAPIAAMNVELAKRDEQIETLKTMVEALQANTKGKRNVAAQTVEETT